MYPRLKLLHKLLADDGAIFISIDDNEQANLKLICDEIFGITNSIGPIIQNKMNSKNDTVNVQKNHEFILIYRKTKIYSNKTKISSTLVNNAFKSKSVIEENGKYYFLNDYITTRGEGGILNARHNLGHTIYYNPITKDIIANCDYDTELAKTSNKEIEVYNTNIELLNEGYEPIRPPRVRGKLGCWTWSLDKINLQKNDLIITGKSGNYGVKKRTFVKPDEVFNEDGKYFIKIFEEGNSRSIIDFSTNEGTKALNEVMNEHNVFDNPKNLGMLEYLINLYPKKNAIVLDSFAGSGSTAQAVLNLNKRDKGNRNFILIEMEDYAETITAERIKKVIKGYDFTGNKKSELASYTVNLTNLKKTEEIIELYNSYKSNIKYSEVKIESINGNISIVGTEKINEKINGINSLFDYFQLGLPLFDEKQNLNEKVDIGKIREYIWFSETRSSFTEPHSEIESSYFLGKKEDALYYFIYEKDTLTTLDYDALVLIKTIAEQYIIYADNCLLPKEFMAKKNIIFKKIPRDITRF
jgi:adenine-specific DNA-methyltransferase